MVAAAGAAAARNEAVRAGSQSPAQLRDAPAPAIKQGAFPARAPRTPATARRTSPAASAIFLAASATWSALNTGMPGGTLTPYWLMIWAPCGAGRVSHGSRVNQVPLTAAAAAAAAGREAAGLARCLQPGSQAFCQCRARAGAGAGCPGSGFRPVEWPPAGSCGPAGVLGPGSDLVLVHVEPALLLQLQLDAPRPLGGLPSDAQHFGLGCGS